MAAMRSFRVREAHPFSIAGIDYAGPLQMIELSLRKARIAKVYIAVFVCMTTKAVHIESVTALSTDAFRLTHDRSLPVVDYRLRSILIVAPILSVQPVSSGT